MCAELLLWPTQAVAARPQPPLLPSHSSCWPTTATTAALTTAAGLCPLTSPRLTNVKVLQGYALSSGSFYPSPSELSGLLLPYRHASYIWTSSPVMYSLASDKRAKVADVGLARMTKTVGTYPSCWSTFDWASPEMLMGKRCSKASDVYSFGEQNSVYGGKAVTQSFMPTHLLSQNFQQLYLPAGTLLWELASTEWPRRGRMRDLRSGQMRWLGSGSHHCCSPHLDQHHFVQPSLPNASRFLLCRVPEEAPRELVKLIEHCTEQESVDRPTMPEVLRRLEALPLPIATVQGGAGPAAPALSPGHISLGDMTSSSSLKQDAAWKIDLKDLEFCKDMHGNDICLGMGPYGQVTYRPRHHSIGLCPPEQQLG